MFRQVARSPVFPFLGSILALHFVPEQALAGLRCSRVGDADGRRGAPDRGCVGARNVPVSRVPPAYTHRPCRHEKCQHQHHAVALELCATASEKTLRAQEGDKCHRIVRSTC